jgi:hypothetical protein
MSWACSTDQASPDFSMASWADLMPSSLMSIATAFR